MGILDVREVFVIGDDGDGVSSSLEVLTPFLLLCESIDLRLVLGYLL